MSGRSGKKVAYLMSRFPKITETFILYEILELERQGVPVEIFPLLRERAPVMHPEAQALVERAHYSRLGSAEVAAAQLYWLRRNPAAYARAWADAIRGNRGSAKFVARALAVVPQAALFARRCAELGVEHVHAHWATHPTLAAYVIRLLTGIPYSFTGHAHDIYVERAMLAEKIRDASFVVTISEYNRRLLAELYGAAAEEKVRVVHCGVDLDVFSPKEGHAAADPLTFICVGSLQEKKGQLHLVEACARLKRSGLRFRCLLVGDGEHREAVAARVARYGLQAEVELLGHQPRARVSELLAAADVMVLPSVTTSSGRQEGIPVAVMEAMAVRLPVISTRISGIPELVEDEQSGLLVTERDDQALATAMLRLALDEGLRARLGQAAREKVMREFNLKRTTAALRELLERDWRAAAPARTLAEGRAL